MFQVQRRRLMVVLVLIAAALVAAGCGSSDSGSTSSSGGSAVKALDINPAPRDKLKAGGTVRWAVDSFTTQWNYNHLDGGTSASATITSGLMPTAFVADEKAALRVNPDYLVSAKVTATSPKQAITYKLNREARWSDGTPITWRDYEAQWKALRGKDSRYLIGSSTGYEQVESVTAGADDYEVITTFATPFSDWQSLYNPLWPASTNNDPEVFNKGWVNKLPVTAGPFKFDSIDKSQKTATIVRDPKWWGEPAKLDRIITRALDQEAGVSAFVNGEVDLVDVGPDASLVKRANSAQAGVVREAAGPDFRHFTINGASGALGDLRVRRAVAMGINRAAIAKADLAGLGFSGVTLGNHFLMNTQAGYKDNSGAVGTYNPDEAGKLLDQAGWKLSGAVRKQAGETLKVRFVIPAGVPTSKQEGELAQAMLAEIGVKLEIVTVPGDAFFDKYVNTGNFDITPFSWIGTPFPISSGKSIYVNPVKDAKGELQIQQNYSRIGSKQLDDLMTQASTTLDIDKARDLINQADTLVWDEAHSLTLFQRPQIWGVNAKLANAGAFGFKSVAYQDLGFLK